MNVDAIGLDVGGANLKAATASGQAWSRPFELWRTPDRLAAALAPVRARWPDITRLAVTMTGELCDCFPTKRDGVRHILASIRDAFPEIEPAIWTTRGWMTPDELAGQDVLLAAATNWHALATHVGRFAPHGAALLIDTGSTTTDIIPLWDGQPVPAGNTDPERLRSGELVYTGVRRTPVCALLGERVAAEWFATTHDVYVRLGRLPAEPENRATADGRPMTAALAHARLSRMLGGDPDITPLADTLQLAEESFARQRSMIRAGIELVAARCRELPGWIIFSGSGEFLARAAWQDYSDRHEFKMLRMCSLADTLGPALSESACAHALAVLLAERLA